LKHKVTHILLLFLSLTGLVSGQISPLADQYLLNPFLTNPAFAGTGSKSPLNIGVRQQWLGFRGAPSWQSGTYHTSLNSKKQHFNPRGFVNKGENSFGNVGLGGGVFNVKYGAISQVGLHLDYAYHIYMGKGRLSLGLATMYHHFIIGKSGFLRPDGSGYDPLIDEDNKEVLHFFDVNAGAHYYSDLFFGGFSVVQLLNSSVSFGDLSFPSVWEFSDNPWLSRNLYLYGGVTPAITKNLTIEPSVLLKYNTQNGFGFQVNLKATINEIFQGGLLYRFKESAGFFAGIRYGDLIFRYQFESPLGTAVQTRFTTNSVLLGVLL